MAEFDRNDLSTWPAPDGAPPGGWRAASLQSIGSEAFGGSLYYGNVIELGNGLWARYVPFRPAPDQSEEG